MALSDDVTPEHIYLSRRRFLKRAGLMAAGAAVFGGCGGGRPSAQADVAQPRLARVPTLPPEAQSAVDDLGNPVTMKTRVQTYGHYYEFAINRMRLMEAAGAYRPPRLRIEVGGLVHNPRVFTRQDLAALEQVERTYRLRCIEAWAMVIPWTGVPLKRLLEIVEPSTEARFVRFESVLDSAQMPGQRPGAYGRGAAGDEASGMAYGVFERFVWPYYEALRLDEAQHDLTILATGMYGKPLHAVSGAPVRLVVPWKYAYKSVKNVARIDLVADQPATFWNYANPSEYGFYANVNPDVPHPRWAQDKEVRYRGACPEPIVPTIPFNGYADQVAHLYEGMDLSAYF